MSNAEITWLCIGFGAQALFTARFVVQWLASERKRESVIPLAFWYLSLTGGMLLLMYAFYRRDPVIITGQAFGVVVYLRNLILIHRKRREDDESERRIHAFANTAPSTRVIQASEVPATMILPTPPSASSGSEIAGLRKAG